jgi:uncharacterized lipoprotein YddW (UPF0748 family)
VQPTTKIPSFAWLAIISLSLLCCQQPTHTQTSSPGKMKMLWIDAEAGVFDVAGREQLGALLDKCCEAGINTIAVDVKNYAGFALYNSQIAPKLAIWNGKTYPKDFDLLKAALEEGHKRGLKVHAALNVFSEGLKKDRQGPVFSHPEWEAVVYDRVPVLRNAEGQKILLQGVNEYSDATGVSVFTPHYGPFLYARDAPLNVADGNSTSLASRWVSADTPEPHWVELTFSEPQVIEAIRLHFDKGYTIPNYTLELGTKNAWAQQVEVKNNSDLIVAHQLSPPQEATKIRFIANDCGLDAIARVREIEVLSQAQGGGLVNIAPRAQVVADSSMDRARGTCLQVAGQRVVQVKAEQELAQTGLAIPRDGYVLVLNAQTASEWLAGVKPGDSLFLTSESDLMTESEYPAGLLVYVNPLHPDVQERMLNILAEVAKGYPIDGIVLDRVRFDNRKVDFSQLSRERFAHETGISVSQWPQDIYTAPDPLDPNSQLTPGPYYKQWIQWRAAHIRSFIEKAKNVVKAASPEIEFGDYVGAWYPVYYEVGANWASESYDPSKDYPWALPGYRHTGYAQVLDYLCPGLYYSMVTIEDAQRQGRNPEESIEGGIQLVKRTVGTSTKIYGSLYYPNLNTPAQFRNAVQMCLEQTDGVMIFSHHFFARDNSWGQLEAALSRTPTMR